MAAGPALAGEDAAPADSGRREWRTSAGEDAGAADSAGVGWRTSAGVIPHSSPLAPSPAPRLEFHLDELRPRRRDVAYVAAATTACALIASQDRELTDRATARDSQTQRDLARIIRPFGHEVVVGGAVAAWGGAWLAHRDALFASVQRVDLSIASASVLTFAVKRIVGRKRPEDSPGDAQVFDSFSGHDTFPSGHATLAFAAAAALDRETSSRWVPAVAYPLAGLVAWSRVHDRKHWTSDVVAGAAIGFGVAWKAEDVLRGRAADTVGARVELEAGGPGTLAAVRLRW